MTVVTTKEQLQEAKKRGDKEIVIEGDLAVSLHSGKAITKLGPIAIAALSAGIIAAPFSAGTSLPLAAGISAAAGGSAITFGSAAGISALVAIGTCGVALLIALYKDYEEIEFCSKPPKLKLKKKSS